MPKSSLPSFKRHSNYADPSTHPVPQSVSHPYIRRISDVLFIVTDNFASPNQHHIYPAAVIYACLIHEGAIRDDPDGMMHQPSPIGFDILARVYNAEARGTPRFAHYARQALSYSAITHGDRMKPDDWNITPAQRGITEENPLFQQLLKEDAARNLRRKATIQSEIEQRRARKIHKRDSDAIKRFTATHQTHADLKLKGKKKTLVSTPITTLASLPVVATPQPIASSSATTLDSLLSPVASTSTSDISMTGPSDEFTLTNDEMLAAFEEDAPFETDPTFDFESLPETTM
jgi:hypothetical protein